MILFPSQNSSALHLITFSVLIWTKIWRYWKREKEKQHGRAVCWIQSELLSVFCLHVGLGCISAVCGCYYKIALYILCCIIKILFALLLKTDSVIPLLTFHFIILGLLNIIFIIYLWSFLVLVLCWERQVKTIPYTTQVSTQLIINHKVHLLGLLKDW